MDNINVRLQSPPSFTVNVGRTGGDIPVYSGSYTVIPKPEDEVVLPTANKLLSDNVTVGRVPFYEVTNQSGGKTFIIGEMNNV